MNVKGVDVKDQFYTALTDLTDPEAKRKAIGKTFIEVFDHEAHLIEGVSWLGQGTIYPDVIESVSVKGPSATIKSHHNVGGLPDFMKLKVVEPLNTLSKTRYGPSVGHWDYPKLSWGVIHFPVRDWPFVFWAMLHRKK